MRLIDADLIDFNVIFGGQSDFAKETREAAKLLIDNQPTAFDVDKVVEQLEAKAKEYQRRINRRSGSCYFDESQKVHDLNERLLGLEQEIEIVKGGGASD